jgi:hypothetical protein
LHLDRLFLLRQPDLADGAFADFLDMVITVDYGASGYGESPRVTE